MVCLFSFPLNYPSHSTGQFHSQCCQSQDPPHPGNNLALLIAIIRRRKHNLAGEENRFEMLCLFH